MLTFIYTLNSFCIYSKFYTLLRLFTDTIWNTTCFCLYEQEKVPTPLCVFKFLNNEYTMNMYLNWNFISFLQVLLFYHYRRGGEKKIVKGTLKTCFAKSLYWLNTGICMCWSVNATQIFRLCHGSILRTYLLWDKTYLIELILRCRSNSFVSM